MRLEFSPLAESDLEAIGDYIAMDSPANAVRFIDGLQDQCEKIARAPMGYVARPELAVDLRSCAHGRYVIFFRPSATLVRIERILHSALDIRAEWVPDGDRPEN